MMWHSAGAPALTSVEKTSAVEGSGCANLESQPLKWLSLFKAFLRCFGVESNETSRSRFSRTANARMVASSAGWNAIGPLCESIQALRSSGACSELACQIVGRNHLEVGVTKKSLALNVAIARMP
jgi:hypothetical protein